MVLSQMSVAAFAVSDQYTVSFEPGEAVNPTDMPIAQVVDSNKKATRPTSDPKWNDSHAFVDWYLGDKAFDFNTLIKEDTKLVAHWSHPWEFIYQPGEDTKAEGRICCSDSGCPYYNGFAIRLEVEDVLHVDDAEKYIKLVDPSDDPEFPSDKYEIGDILYYKGTIT